MTRKPNENASITLAQMQPEVMQPVTMTVSTRSFVKIAAAGVAKKIEGALHQQHIRTHRGDAWIEFHRGRAAQQIEHRPHLPMRRGARAVVAIDAGDYRQSGALRRLYHRDGIEHRLIHHRRAAHRERRISEAALEIHHHDADLRAEAECPTAIATFRVNVRHALVSFRQCFASPPTTIRRVAPTGEGGCRFGSSGQVP
jgi:hypothetical protein